MEAFGVDADWFLSRSPRSWPAQLSNDRATLIRVTASVLELVLPEWREARPKDPVPVRVFEAARSDPLGEGQKVREYLKILAKACGESRRRSLGYEHRIAEAARELAHAVTARSLEETREATGEMLDRVEAHLLYRLAVQGVYGKEREIREQILRRLLEANASAP